MKNELVINNNNYNSYYFDYKGSMPSSKVYLEDFYRKVVKSNNIMDFCCPHCNFITEIDFTKNGLSENDYIKCKCGQYFEIVDKISIEMNKQQDETKKDSFNIWWLRSSGFSGRRVLKLIKRTKKEVFDKLLDKESEYSELTRQYLRSMNIKLESEEHKIYELN